MQAQRQAAAAARAAARHLVVDGEEFAVRASTTEGVRSENHDWPTGPNPGCGFGGGSEDELTDDAAATASMRQLLAVADRATGCVED